MCVACLLVLLVPQFWMVRALMNVAPALMICRARIGRPLHDRTVALAVTPVTRTVMGLVALLRLITMGSVALYVPAASLISTVEVRPARASATWADALRTCRGHEQQVM